MLGRCSNAHLYLLLFAKQCLANKVHSSSPLRILAEIASAGARPSSANVRLAVEFASGTNVALSRRLSAIERWPNR